VVGRLLAEAIFLTFTRRWCARIGNPRFRKRQEQLEEPGPIRKQAASSTCTNGSIRFAQEESGWYAHKLKTVARKGLWVRVPRPPLNGPLTWAFAIPAL
jgi:hypothetical protein